MGNQNLETGWRRDLDQNKKMSVKSEVLVESSAAAGLEHNFHGTEQNHQIQPSAEVP